MATLLVVTGCVSSQPAPKTNPADSTATFPPARTQEMLAAISPDQALAELRAGNARFVAGQRRPRDFHASVRATAAGQYPFAVILSCLDSRMPVEIIFDQGIGDVFSVRVAGNVLDGDILGSLEFACRASGAKLIAVVGHSRCGAIKGAVDDVEAGNLTDLLARIKPAVAAVPAGPPPRTSQNDEFVQKVAEAHVRRVMRQIRQQSPVLQGMIDARKVGLAGGMYDLDTGEVHFFPN